MENNILNIYCPNCGAPAQFDIVNQVYKCRYCGSSVSVEEAKKEKSSIVMSEGRKAENTFGFQTATCTGCGATVVFEENEALAGCEFCGRSLVRKNYANMSDLPHYVVPFGVTREEAMEKLLEWCDNNRKKSEAKHLRDKISELRGYYLPYEMVQGPVYCTVKKRSETAAYEASGYLNGEFINCSKQLDNLVLDAMEPFDLNNLQEFDFAYVAGCRVKLCDIDKNEVSKRLHDEAESNYRIRLEQLWGTKSINLNTKVEEVVRFPVLLPVYYIADGDVKAAVNGQTGKVSVCAEKLSSYLSVPWWLKGIAVLLLALGATFGAMLAGGMDYTESLYIAGVLGIFYLIVFACMFSDGGSTEFGISHYRQIFNSGIQTYRREKGKLVMNDEVLKRRIAEPVFLRELDGRPAHVSYTFNSPKRMIFMILLSLVVIFLPVIIALFVNGFDFGRLSPGGSAVWFCITVPVVPIYLVRFGIQWLYENPWIYVFTEDGKRKRYRKNTAGSKTKVGEIVKICLGLLFAPPICFAVWFAIIGFVVMVYLTAFGA